MAFSFQKLIKINKLGCPNLTNIEKVREKAVQRIHEMVWMSVGGGVDFFTESVVGDGEWATPHWASQRC